MGNTNENVVNEVNQSDVNNVAAESNVKDSNKKLIIKIIVGILIFLAVIGIAAFIFWLSLANKIVDESKDTINSIVNMGQSLVDDALEGTGINKTDGNIENSSSTIINNSQSNSKTVITADRFAEVMKSKGYEVIDTTSSFAEAGDYVKKSYLARTTGYQIEFYELSTVANAIESYNSNKTKFESQKGTTSSYSTMSRNNYSTYALTTNGKYQYIARVDNTNLYMDVAEEYKDVVKNIVNELGY